MRAGGDRLGPRPARRREGQPGYGPVPEEGTRRASDAGGDAPRTAQGRSRRADPTSRRVDDGGDRGAAASFGAIGETELQQPPIALHPVQHLRERSRKVRHGQTCRSRLKAPDCGLSAVRSHLAIRTAAGKSAIRRVQHRRKLSTLGRARLGSPVEPEGARTAPTTGWAGCAAASARRSLGVSEPKALGIRLWRLTTRPTPTSRPST